MKKLFKEIDGLQIECLVSTGDSAPIFIFHGNSSCADAYENLLNSELGRRYQLIAVSFPGHGASSYYQSNIEFVSIAMLGQLTAKIVQAFNPSSYLLIGQSLGGHALLESLHLHPKATGLCLVSAPPFSLTTIGSVFREDPTGGLLFTNQLDQYAIEQFARAFVHNEGRENLELLKTHIRTTEGLFREHLGKSLALGLLEDELLSLVNSKIPCLLLQGLEDKFIHNDYYQYLVQNDTPIELVQFTNTGHAIQLEAPQQFEHVLGEFIYQHLLTGVSHALSDSRELQHA